MKVEKLDLINTEKEGYSKIDFICVARKSRLGGIL